MSRNSDTNFGGPSTSKSSGTNLPAAPLRFHSVRDTIELSPDKFTARLAESAVCGPVFGDRPVRVNEKVCLRFVDFKTGMGSGCYLSIGFINTDPATLGKSNPMTAGCWIEWLKNLNYEKDKILHYYFNEKGEIHYGINGEELRMITPKANTNGPLWASIQLFGGLREVRLADPATLDGVQTLTGPSTSKSSGTNLPAAPLRFHRVLETIELSTDKSTARLEESAVSGPVFSDRPVRVNEKVCLRFVDIEIGMGSGCYLSIGFINTEPATLGKSMPNILNPMTTGYCIEWLKNLHYEKDKMLHYYFNEKGEIHYGINGEELHMITPKVNTNDPLWAAIQLFGGLREVQLADPEMLDGVRSPNQSQVKGGVRNPNQNQATGGVRRRNQNQVKDGLKHRNQNQANDGVSRQNQNQANDGLSRQNQNQHRNQNQVTNDLLVNRIRSLSIEKSLPASTYQKRFVPLSLHRTKGRNINFCNTGIVGKREGTYSHSYVFSAQPITLGQTIVIQIIAAEVINRGTLDIGLTSRNPATLTPPRLPNNAMDFLDCPGNWQIHRHDENILQIGDELALTLTQEGKMVVTKNNSTDPVQTITMGHMVNFWAFFDIWGKIQKVKLLISDVEKKKTKKHQKKNYKMEEKAVLPSKPGQSLSECSKNYKTKEKAVLPKTGGLSECTICLENQIDSVIYKCGHMCMCFNCAMAQWKGKGSVFGKCPLCRGLITDVIRTYIP